MPNKKLRECAASGDISGCRRLLQRLDVDINSAGPTTGRTALHWAVEKKHYELVSFLLEKGAKLTRDVDGYTPYALTSEMRMTRILGPSLQFQSHPSSRSTAQMERQVRQMAADGNLAQCQVLFEAGVNINAAGPDTGKTALYWAAIKKQMHIVEFLIESGVSIDPHVKKIEKLETSYEIKKALFYRWSNDIEGPDLPVLPPNEALNYGFHVSGDSIIELQKALEMGRIENLKTQLKDLHRKSIFAFQGRPILSFISYSEGDRFQTLIKTCLLLGFDPNLRAHMIQFDSYRGTCLMEILANEKVSKALVFIRLVAEHSSISIDPAIQDSEKKTIVHMATLLPQADCLPFILTELDCTAAINCQDEDGNTPLHHAYLLGDRSKMRLLEERGADPLVVNNEGQTPLDRLHNSTLGDVVKALKKFHIVPVRGTDGKKLIDIIEAARVVAKMEHPSERAQVKP